jgi:hypothetical protein
MLRLAITTAGRPPNGRSSLIVFFTILMAWVSNLSCGRVMMGGRGSKRLLCVLFFGYAKAYAENKGAPSDVMMQAHLLKVRGAFEIDIINVVSAFVLSPPFPQSEHTIATTLCQNILKETAEAAAARQHRLEAVEQGMGLSMPGRSVKGPCIRLRA